VIFSYNFQPLGLCLCCTCYTLCTVQ